MKVQVSFKHLEHTPALDEIIQSKSEKLEKYLGGNINVQWVCYVQEGKHYAEIKLLGPQFEYHAKGHSESMYKTCDVVIEKIEKQLIKKKQKWKNHIHHKHEVLLKDEFVNEIEKDEEAVIQAQYDEDVA